MDSPSNSSTVPETAAIRVLATPELLEKILSNFKVAQIFPLRRVNKNFSNIFNIAPSLLRTMGVQTSLRAAVPPDHIERFMPLVRGLKKKELLIRPFQFHGVSTDNDSKMQVLSFSLDTSLAEFAKECGTIIGRAGRSGKDYGADNSWGGIAIATTAFVLSIDVDIDVRKGSVSRWTYRMEWTIPQGEATLGQLFSRLAEVRDTSLKEHERRCKIATGNIGRVQRRHDQLHYYHATGRVVI